MADLSWRDVAPRGTMRGGAPRVARFLQLTFSGRPDPADDAFEPKVAWAEYDLVGDSDAAGDALRSPAPPANDLLRLVNRDGWTFAVGSGGVKVPRIGPNFLMNRKGYTLLLAFARIEKGKGFDYSCLVRARGWDDVTTPKSATSRAAVYLKDSRCFIGEGKARRLAEYVVIRFSNSDDQRALVAWARLHHDRAQPRASSTTSSTSVQARPTSHILPPEVLRRLGLLALAPEWPDFRDTEAKRLDESRSGDSWYFVCINPHGFMPWERHILKALQRGVRVSMAYVDLLKLSEQGPVGKLYAAAMCGHGNAETDGIRAAAKQTRAHVTSLCDAIDGLGPTDFKLVETVFPHPFLGFLCVAPRGERVDGWGLVTPYIHYVNYGDSSAKSERRRRAKPEPSIHNFGVLFDASGTLFHDYRKGIENYFELLLANEGLFRGGR